MAALKKHPTVCLNMIVKNESAVIVRCLSSLKHILDYWVIVDTGSTDGTQEIVGDYMKDVPGELFERPWIDFSHNRTEALRLAKGKADYLFIIDADEVLALDGDFSWKDLYLDSYMVEFQDHGISYERCQIVNNHLNWYYVGILHEYIECKEAGNNGKYEGIKIVRFLDGARSSDPEKFRKDAMMLEKALLNEPDNDRYVFYLAQSYRDAGNIEMAILYYKKRIEMKRWHEEVWYSMYQIAQLMEKRGDDWNGVLQAYLQAFQFLPTRAEPLFRILRYYMYNGQQYHIAYIFGKKAIEIPFPAHGLFVENQIYEVILPMEYAICSFYTGNDEDAISANNTILKREDVPGEMYVRILANRKFSLDRMYQKKKIASDQDQHIRVLIPFTNPGHFLDNNIESLVNQDYGSFEMVFIDNGSTDGSFEKIPEGDERITKIRHNTAISEGECLHEVLSGHFEDDEICFIINGDDWLENNQVLSAVNKYFQLYDCQLLCGQFRFSDGRLGYSLPLASITEMDTEPFLPLACAFRTATYHQLSKKYKDIGFMKSANGNWLEGGQAQFALAKNLIKQIGLGKAHYNDTVMINYNIDRLSGIVFPGLEKWVKKIKRKDAFSEAVI